jgi:hypothetical protein
MKLIMEITEQCNVITEEKDGEKAFFIEGPFMQYGIKNRNNRMYPKGVLVNEMTRYVKEYIDKNRAYGELGHPSGPTINLERVSHMIKELKDDGNGSIMGKAKILDTPYGNIVKNLIKEGAQLGVSSRGMGNLKKMNEMDVVQDDFYLATAADIVADPSAPAAFVQGIMEGKEWMMVDGKFLESDAEKARKEIDSSVNRRELVETQVKIFQKFLSNL